MGKFDGWLFVSDIDGTLLSAPNYTLSDENRAAIKEFTKGGGRFVFATGRCLFGIMDLYHQLTLDTPIIAANGSMLYDPVSDTFPYIAEIDKEKALDIYHYAKKRLPRAGFEIFNDRRIYFIDDNETVQHHIRVESIPYPFVSIDEAKGPWTKIVFAVLPSDMPESRKVVFSAPTAESFCITQSADYYLELSKKDITKGSTALLLAGQLNIDRDHIITLGDNENDISMFKITPHSFAVSTATEIAKEAAAYQTGPGGSDGKAVADVLKLLK